MHKVKKAHKTRPLPGKSLFSKRKGDVFTSHMAPFIFPVSHDKGKVETPKAQVRRAQKRAEEPTYPVGRPPPPTRSRSDTIYEGPLLSEALQASYDGTKGREAIESLSKKGFVLDINLSDGDQKVFYNPHNKKLLYSVAGSHNLDDWIHTDIAHFFGQLKSTPRYQKAKKGLETAREKYQPEDVIITGHSLGASLGSLSAKKEDKVWTWNGFSNFGQPNRKNAKVFRAANDIPSLLSAWQPTTTTFKEPQLETKGAFNLFGRFSERHGLDILAKNYDQSLYYPPELNQLNYNAVE